MREFKAIRRDKGAVLILFLALIIYPIIYSIAYKNEVLKDVPIAIIDNDKTSTSRLYIRMLHATEQIHVAMSVNSMEEAQFLFYEGKICGIVLIPSNFEKHILLQQQTTPTLYADASYVLMYKQLYTGAVAATSTLSAGVEIKKLMSSGCTFEQSKQKQMPIDVTVNQLYNPAAGYGSYIMPAIILIAMQQTLLIGIGLIGATFKEKEKKQKLRGSYVSIVLGKTLSYFSIYMLNSIIALLCIYTWFNYPDKSLFYNTYIILIPFFLDTIFLGLILTVLFKKRVHSLLILVFLSPLVLFLSGITWPKQSIPEVLQLFSLLFPSNFGVPAYIKCRVEGSNLSAYATDWLGLVIQMSVYFILALVLYKRKMNANKIITKN